MSRYTLDLNHTGTALKPAKAVIYARVSSAAQVRRGDGLGSQETRCREFAGYRGYTVVKVFSDDLSGSSVERPGMKAMLSFLRKNKHDPHAVLIDDISRLARGVKAHIELRSAISLAGGVLESPTLEFGDDADSELQEYILATVSQHQRRKNAEQTLNRMKARVRSGYWVFSRPWGYRYEKTRNEGKILVRDEPIASILQEGLAGFATGRFETKSEVRRFWEAQSLFSKRRKDGSIHPQLVHDLLTNPIYAGLVQAPDWKIGLREGRHKGLITAGDFDKIQAHLTNLAKAPARKDLNTDFPLRGFVACGDCGHPLTSCWSKSNTGKKHPYYFCFKKGCDSYRKSIRKEDLEGAFDTLLGSLKPTKTLFSLVREMLKDAWDQRLSQVTELRKSLTQAAAKIEKQIEQLLDRIVEASNPSVISAYEKRIASLEKDKLVIAEQERTAGQPKHAFEKVFELAMTFLSNPQKLWASDRLEVKRLVLRLAFSDHLHYHREKGFSNPNFSLPFKTLTAIGDQEMQMAHRGGFEPPTPWFVAMYSIQLSYRCVGEKTSSQIAYSCCKSKASSFLEVAPIGRMSRLQRTEMKSFGALFRDGSPVNLI